MISIGILLLDTLWNGYAAIQSFGYFADSIALKAANYITCIALLISILIANSSLDVMLIRRFFLGCYILRLLAKIAELFYIVIDNHEQKNRVLVEFNVAGLLEVTIL